jgi:spermidine synthase
VKRTATPIAALLFFSGMCALVYQVAWLRELRLVFGASTPASAAVLAVFMGGLGLGALLLGQRAESATEPLAVYAQLELGIALLAGVTPGLLWVARRGYLALGGSLALGEFGGTLARLGLAALVLLPPTILMGGTLPAAARAATDGGDRDRRATALLYGANTLGAVVGTVASSFILLEVFGTRVTLWMGCLLNLLVALAARTLARDLRRDAAPPSSDPAEAARNASEAGLETAGLEAAPPRFVLFAAAASGFVFLLMELVWYRVLSPLLGGSSYTFGLILAVALFGIGVGGLLYTSQGSRRATTLSAFALTCGLEALAVAVPFALGDRVAWLTLFLRSMGSVGLYGHAAAWTFITALVVLPAAVVSGYQFPLLIALLGRGQQGLGRHVGLAYATNTLGSIVGSLAGGFVVLPTLGALGAWKLTVWSLVALAVASVVLAARREGAADGPVRRGYVPMGLVALAVAMLHGSLGPTAFWRHSPIGVGRSDDLVYRATRNSMEAEWRARNAFTSWEVDGRESAIALNTAADTAFVVNGKSDGAATIDSGTQVMGGLLGALLHPKEVRRALVIGLGTGSTAGWLAALPEIERVDVVELEPAIVEVARACAPVNHGVLENPKVHLMVADAREVLLTTREKYDLIFSEPSNPYRAGIASLFTREFYAAARDRLEKDGLFVQWLQAYEIDARSVRSVYATLASAFGSIETWRTRVNDLLLISRANALPLDVDVLGERIRREPYREALLATWRAQTIEEVLAHHVAQPGLARAVAEADGEASINTDDRNLLEFSVARAIGRPQDFSVESQMLIARARGEERPLLAEASRGKVDWLQVYDGLVSLGIATHERTVAPLFVELSPEMQHRYRAHVSWSIGGFGTVVREWEAQPKEPSNAVELVMLADSYAALGLTEKATELARKLRPLLPIEADAVEAKLHFAEKRYAEAFPPLEKALLAYRTVPWPNEKLMERLVEMAGELAVREPSLAPRIFEVLSVDFAMKMHRALRLRLVLDVALALSGDACVEVVRSYGRYFPWMLAQLDQRVACYERAKHPGLEHAKAERDAFVADGGADFGASIQPERAKAKIRFTTTPDP